MLLYGLFLAYETRNVVYPHLNDSRVIGICVYNVVVLSMIGAFLSVILDDKQFKELYASLSLCIIFPASSTISLIFIPKVRTTNLNVFYIFCVLCIYILCYGQKGIKSAYSFRA